MGDAALESVRLTIPAGRALPLLHAIANREASALVLAYLDAMQMAIEVAPC